MTSLYTMDSLIQSTFSKKLKKQIDRTTSTNPSIPVFTFISEDNLEEAMPEYYLIDAFRLNRQVDGFGEVTVDDRFQ